MKSYLLALVLSPAFLLAQKPNNLQNVAVKVNPEKLKKDFVSPLKTTTSTPVVSHGKVTTPYNVNATIIGRTTYDLQTNNAMPRRIEVYTGGKVSVVWTSSDETNSTFLNRGTGFNHFDGTSWVGQNLTRFEPDRAGWPNLVTVQDSNIARNYIISHYASGADLQLSGGTFWTKNNGIDSTRFYSFKTVDKPYGPLWPRAVSNGKYIHMISVYQRPVKMAGVRSPIVYYRYNVATQVMEKDKITLPGYDSTRFVQGEADTYAIDVQDSTVAIVIGGPTNDVALWKSTDNGNTWTKTIVWPFKYAPYDTKGNQTFNDTVVTNDGCVAVLLDKNNAAHVFWPRMRILDQTPGDSSYSYFPGTDGIVHWDDAGDSNSVIGYSIDYDQSGVLELKSGTTDRNYAGYGNALSTYPIASLEKDSNNLYMLYSAPNEADYTPDEQSNYRDIYAVFSRDGGKTWDAPQDVTTNVHYEDVFPTIGREVVGGKIYMSWMQDELPGIFLINNTTPNVHNIMFATLPVADLKQHKVGTFNVGIENSENSTFRINSIYPNPTSGEVNISLELNKAGKANVKVLDILGQDVSPANQVQLPAGKNMVSLDLNRLNPGVYFVQVSVNGYTSTQKLVKE